MPKSKVSRISRIAVVLAVTCLLAASWIGSGVDARSDRGVTLISEQGQDRKPATPEKKAEEVYRSIQTFKGLPASVVMGAMEKISGFLGVDCDHCHVMGEFEKEDKKQKEETRLMFRMVGTIGRELKTNRVTCYTCHRGHARPEPMPAEQQAMSDAAMKKAAGDKRPAVEAYKNIQMLKGATAGELTAIMSSFTSALGVDCTYCHDLSGFDKDTKPQKVAARTMLSMGDAVAKEHFEGKSPLNCYTCHRGKTHPPSTAAER